jgi:hyperosmotically inducible protein
MKKITTVLLTSLLIFGTAACSNLEKTSANADKQVGMTNNAPTKPQAQQDLGDAQSQIRRKQLDEDIQAREQRNNFFNNGSANNRANNDIASEVRDTLEANLPSSELTVESQQGVVTVAGTVPTREQLARIKPLAIAIKGVRGVNVEANVLTARSN